LTSKLFLAKGLSGRTNLPWRMSRSHWQMPARCA